MSANQALQTVLKKVSRKMVESVPAPVAVNGQQAIMHWWHLGSQQARHVRQLAAAEILGIAG